MLKIDVCWCFGGGERVESSWVGKKRREWMDGLGLGNSGWAPREIRQDSAFKSEMYLGPPGAMTMY
jgi:hypothetical protein